MNPPVDGVVQKAQKEFIKKILYAVHYLLFLNGLLPSELKIYRRSPTKQVNKELRTYLFKR